MEGTVALDDIAYSAGASCHSSPELPGQGAGITVAVRVRLALLGALRSGCGRSQLFRQHLLPLQSAPPAAL